MLPRADLPPGCEVPGRESSRRTGIVRAVAVAVAVVATGAAAAAAGNALHVVADVAAADTIVVATFVVVAAAVNVAPIAPATLAVDSANRAGPEAAAATVVAAFVTVVVGGCCRSGATASGADASTANVAAFTVDAATDVSVVVVSNDLSVPEGGVWSRDVVGGVDAVRVGRGGVVWRVGSGQEALRGLILGPNGLPPWRGGLVREVQEGRGSLCPRGLGSLRFDGRSGGMSSALAKPGGRGPRKGGEYLP